MRRKLWLLLILFLFLVGRESCCASQEENIEEQVKELQKKVEDFLENHIILLFTIGVPCTFLGYWYFDLHQKEAGWYTCKFYYAGGYRTELFYNRIYFDFYYSLFRFNMYFFMMNINVRIYRDFYIFLPIPVLYTLLLVVMR